MRPHAWTAKKQWTRSELVRERQEFFDTRVTGHVEIWATLRSVIDLLADGDIATAQSILDAAAITVPTGDLKNGAYDEAGNLYQMPEHIVSDPTNLVLDQEIKKTETLNDVTDDEEELDRKREEKGKAVLKIGDVIKVKARLSDRGGPDVVVAIGKDQAIRVLVRRIQEETNVWTTVYLLIMRDWLTVRTGSKLEDRIYGQNPQGWRDVASAGMARRSCRQRIGVWCLIGLPTHCERFHYQSSIPGLWTDKVLGSFGIYGCCLSWHSMAPCFHHGTHLWGHLGARKWSRYNFM